MIDNIFKAKSVPGITQILQVRRNLLISSSILIGIFGFNPDITVDNILGIKITDLSTNDLILIIFLITLYYFLNFIGHTISSIKHSNIENSGFTADVIKELQADSAGFSNVNDDTTVGDEDKPTLKRWFEWNISKAFSYNKQFYFKANEYVEEI